MLPHAILAKDERRRVVSNIYLAIGGTFAAGWLIVTRKDKACTGSGCVLFRIITVLMIIGLWPIAIPIFILLRLADRTG